MKCPLDSRFKIKVRRPYMLEKGLELLHHECMATPHAASYFIHLSLPLALGKLDILLTKLC